MEATALVHAHPSDSFEGRITNLLLFSYSCRPVGPAVPTPETSSYWFDADALRDEIKVVGQGRLIPFVRCICCEREKGAEEAQPLISRMAQDGL